MSPPDRTLVVFADEDEEFARGYLAPALGGSGDGPSKVQLLSGAALRALPVVELERLLDEHRAILLVLTPAFLSDPWVRVSEQLASAKAIPGETRVIPLRLIDCEVPLRLEAKTGLDFFEEEGEARWELWAELVERLRRDLALPRPPPREVRCPYPGLRPYTGDEGAYYFGRAAEIDETVERLVAGARELFLVGPSGCGKSSLLYAGVVPRLLARAAAEDRRLFVRQLRPGATPVAALYHALAGSGAKASPSASSVEAAAEALLRSSPHGELLVVIDQLEEVFTQADVGAQRELAAALKELREKPQVSLLLALRADFFADLLQSELWQESKKAQVSVAPLRKAALREAIEGPARACGVYLESGLTEVLLADAAEEPGALPLLQETLLKLWQHRRERLLPLSAYRAMSTSGKSGMATALAQHADRAFAELDAAQQTVAKRAMLRLVTFGDGRPHTRRRQRRRELRSGAATPGQPAAAPRDDLTPVLDALARARLLTIDSGEAQHDPEDDAVDLCHDALVAGWPQLAAWIGARKADEVQRRRLEVAAQEWVDAGRGDSGLLDAKRYAAAAAWMDSEGARDAGWSDDVTALAAASKRALEQRARRTRRRLIGTFIAVGVGLLVAAGQGIWTLREQSRAVRNERRALQSERTAQASEARAKEQQRQANELRVQQYLRLAAAHLSADEPQLAIPLLVAARQLGHDSFALRSHFRRATRVVQIAAQKGGPSAHPMGVLSPDGEHALLYGRDRDVVLWRPRSNSIVAVLSHEGVIEWAAFSPDGTRIVTADAQRRTLVLWDATSLPPRRIDLAEDEPRVGAPSYRQIAPHVHARRVASGDAYARFSEDGAVLLDVYDGRPRLWDAKTGAALGPPFGERRVTSTALSNERVAAVRGDCVISWRLRSPVEERRWCGLPPIAQIAFVRRGELVAIRFHISPHVTLWDPATGQETRVLPPDGGGEAVAAFASAHGSEWLVTADTATVRRWDLHQPARPALSYDPRCQIRGIIAAASDDRVIVLCADRSAQLVDLITGTLLASLYCPGEVEHVGLSRDASAALTIESDGTMRVWSLRGAPGPRVVTVPNWQVAVMSPDAASVATREQRISTRDGKGIALQRAEGDAPIYWRFSPDGSWIVGVARNRALRVWHVPSGRLVLQTEGGVAEQPRLVAWSADSTWLAAVAPSPPESVIERVLLWQAGSSATRTLPQSFPGAVHALALPGSGTLLIAGTAGLVQRWSLHDASVQDVIDVREQSDAVPWSHANFSSDGRWLAATTERTLRVWRTDGSPLVRQAEGLVADRVFFGRSPSLLLVAERADKRGLRERLRVWELESGEQLAGPEHASADFSDFDQATGQRTVTTVATRATVRLARTDEPLGELRHAEEIRDARFSDDGRWLALWSSVGTLVLWDVTVDDTSPEDWQAIDRSNVVPPLAQQRGRSTFSLTPVRDSAGASTVDP